MKVIKFGGSSVATPERVKDVAAIVIPSAKNEGTRAVVVSAFGGVTDELIAVARIASTGDERYKERLNELQQRHVNVIQTIIPSSSQSEILVRLKMWFRDLEDVLAGVFLVGELSKRCLDYVMSFGELFSASILTDYLCSQKIDAEFLDAREIICCDDSFGAGRVLFADTEKLVQAYFKKHSALQIVTGFIARTENRDTITLGRGGSDYTVSIIGAALHADEVEIWTDVDGILSADPRKVSRAFSQAQVTFEEAMELSHFGAKVIYPPTIQPAREQGISIRIRNTFNPSYSGTIVTSESRADRTSVTGISSIDRISLLRIQGSGMVGVAGVAMRLFGALAQAEISVILITQASSEHTICFAVRPDDAEAARKAADKEFELEIAANLVDPIVVDNDCSVISVVGESMRHSPGTAGKVFHALGRNGVNVQAIAQGSSEINISAVVRLADEYKALNALHEEFFFPEKRTLNIFLVGTGLIGSALLHQIERHAEYLRTELSHEIQIVGVANSKRMVVNRQGVPLATCREVLAQSDQVTDIKGFVAEAMRLNLPNTVFVDCTASEQVIALYEELLRSSVSVVTPNKKGLTGLYDQYATLRRAASKRGVHFLYETCVGAGLPVISTLRDLFRSGDEIIRIEAVLSGTLSYIFNTFSGEQKLSKVVLDAKNAGFTEPDPRDDLSGQDVGRKLLILSREIGLKLELDDIKVENLVPEECRDIEGAEKFLEALKSFDAQFEDRRAKSAASGERLCYVGTIEKNEAWVRLESLPPSHPFFGLSGSDNIISFTTKRYSDRPLVVKGSGAGAEVTAAGVFADLLRVAH